MKQGITKSMMLMTVILIDLLAGMEFDLFDGHRIRVCIPDKV